MTSEDRTTGSEDQGMHEESDALDRLLAETRIEVREGFAGEVMERLPPAPWRRRKREWVIAAAVGVLLGAVAAWLFASTEGSSLAVVGALAQLVVGTLVAGGGLLSASWHSLGQAVDSALEGSSLNLVGLGVAAAAAYAALVLLLRRRVGASRRSRREE